MGADVAAAVALQAFFRVPHRHADGDAALFKGGQAHVHYPVLIALEGADGQEVALLGVDRVEELRHHRRYVPGRGGLVLGVRPGGGHVDGLQPLAAGVDGGQVAADHVFALGKVGLFGGRLHVGHGLLDGDDGHQVEEGRLQHHVEVAAQAQLPGELDRVDGIKAQTLAGDFPFGVGGQVGFERLRVPGTVDQQGPAGANFFGNVVFFNVGGVVAGHKVRRFHVVGRADRLLSEAQVALGHAEALLGVVFKVGLGEERGVAVDDFHRVLVRPDGAVPAQAPELAADGPAAGRNAVRQKGVRQGKARHVVGNADGEVGKRTGGLQVFKGSGDLAGGGVLAGQAVAAADHGDVPAAAQGGAHVLIQGLACAARFLGAVEYGDGADGGRQGGDEAPDVERPVQVHLHEAYLFAGGIQRVDHFLGAAGDGAHGHHDPVGVRRAVIVEAVVFPAGDLLDPAQDLFDGVRQGVVVLVAGLPDLEEDVRVLHGGADHGVLWVQGVGAEGVQGVLIDQGPQVLVADRLHLVDLVAGAEAVKEVHEGDPGFERRRVGHARQVHDLLDAAAGQHRKAGVPAAHHVGMVAEDGQGVGADRAGRHVQHARQALAGDAVQHRDHQHQALGGGEARRQRAGLQGAVYGGDGAGFRLHLHQPDRLSEQVLFPLGRPQVGLPGHGGGGGDRVDGGDLSEGVRHVRGGFVAVHGQEGFWFGQRESLLCSCSITRI